MKEVQNLNNFESLSHFLNKSINIRGRIFDLIKIRNVII